MNSSSFTSLIVLLGLSAIILTGCGKHAEDGHSHSDDKHAHTHEEETPGDASFQPGKGIVLTAATRRSIGLETTEVIERKLPLEIRFTAQVFGENHKLTAPEAYHADCTAKAAGLVPQKDAAQLQPGASAQLAMKSGESFGGALLGLNKALALGDVEVLVGATNSGALLKPGDFVSVTVSIPREQPVATVPNSAVLRSAEGTFAYTQHSDAYVRTPIKTGAEGEGFVEVIEGLQKGEMVVTKPVEKLWLIELRATKGGGHAH